MTRDPLEWNHRNPVLELPSGDELHILKPTHEGFKGYRCEVWVYDEGREMYAAKEISIATFSGPWREILWKQLGRDIREIIALHVAARMGALK